MLNFDLSIDCYNDIFKEVAKLELNNYMETVVREVTDELLKQSKEICTCDKCRLDVMAIALNNLSPRYYVTPKGRVFSKLKSTYTDFRAQVVAEVAKAILLVEKLPQHENAFI